MATKKHSKSTRAKARTAKAPAATEQPKRQLSDLSDHIEAQRTLLFQAMGILDCVRHVMGDGGPIGEPDQPRALDAAWAILDKVTDALAGVGDLNIEVAS